METSPVVFCYVVHTDGRNGGKGVLVTRNKDEAIQFAMAIVDNGSSAKIEREKTFDDGD